MNIQTGWVGRASARQVSLLAALSVSLEEIDVTEAMADAAEQGRLWTGQTSWKGSDSSDELDRSDGLDTSDGWGQESGEDPRTLFLFL